MSIRSGMVLVVYTSKFIQSCVLCGATGIPGRGTLVLFGFYLVIIIIHFFLFIICIIMTPLGGVIGPGELESHPP